VEVAGRKLANVSEVRFEGDPNAVFAAPVRTSPKRLVVRVPAGALTGRLRLLTPGGAKAMTRQSLRVADPAQVLNGFRLRGSKLRPAKAFFDQPAPIRLRYRFDAPERTRVRVQVVRARGTRVIRTYRKSQLPFVRYSQTWNALERDGDVANDGLYRFRVGAAGEPSAVAGKMKLYGFKFPVRGPHSYGGHLQEFGAPRSGGRRHQGQDVYADCGTRLEAARGGRVQAKAYDPRLYGHFVVIDIRKSSADHMYSHMPSPSPFGQGARVRTGQRIGAVGKTGNARTTPCHLHFEIWPKGWRNGSPIDPEPALRRWDGYS